MLRRDLPLDTRHGYLIRLADGRIAPSPEGLLWHAPQAWPDEALPLGYWHDEPIAVSLEASEESKHWPDGREWLARLPESHYPLLSTVLQLGHWWRDHRFCGRCGAQAIRLDHEFAMHCDACGHRNYPRISPCIITLVTHGDAMLLARSPRFPPGRYSTLAGFIEPGEAAEEAVRREVFEEVGVQVGRISYYRSQAWPFPHSLMLGFFAEAASRRIRIDEKEIADAAWFSPRQLPQLPPPYSISRALIESHLQAVSRDGR
ncbi:MULTISPECIES: NAD(+) diphosphatase [Halomonadaceae]|uniref:NAD(+) diphosphatase n=1 Tax=Halomonadaceae TaxID=28256 RepID=UPI00159A51AD|nr:MULTISPECIES: NAD(+) diphosphatase [Halomonas]QJQ96233.1 NAD(+) diphosphatase [Halomonas sp. PA5]